MPPMLQRYQQNYRPCCWPAGYKSEKEVRSKSRKVQISKWTTYFRAGGGAEYRLNDILGYFKWRRFWMLFFKYGTPHPVFRHGPYTNCRNSTPGANKGIAWVGGYIALTIKYANMAFLSLPVLRWDSFKSCVFVNHGRWELWWLFWWQVVRPHKLGCLFWARSVRQVEGLSECSTGWGAVSVPW
jgi:hypothetical protein